jgi:hypothetical protein
MTLNYL